MKLNHFQKKLSELWTEESGQSTTEYILILSAVVMIAVKFKSTITTKLDKIVNKVSDDIESNIGAN